jgi:DNA-binding beta-propeller fold protein YncE
MMILTLVLMFMGMIDPVFAQSSNPSLQSKAVAIPGGEGGIGMDDLVFSSELHKVLVPAGHTGKLYLIDPVSYEMTNVGGFSSSAVFQKGHDVGISSAAEGEGYLFVADHGTHQLDAVDVKTGKIIAEAPLAADPDIIRYVAINHEVWVTQPDDKDKKQIEIFSFTAGDKPKLSHSMFIAVPEGPESLTIDNTHQRAYTNLGKDAAVIDLKTHTVTANWPNTCEKSRGTAVDEKKNFLFVACGEGKAVVFDLNQNGKQVGSLTTGPGADLVDYNPDLSHFYITGSKNATLSVLGVSGKGELSMLGIGEAAIRSHCVIGDDQNNIWVCDPKHGQLLRYRDNFPTVR